MLRRSKSKRSASSETRWWRRDERQFDGVSGSRIKAAEAKQFAPMILHDFSAHAGSNRSRLALTANQRLQTRAIDIARVDAASVVAKTQADGSLLNPCLDLNRAKAPMREQNRL